MMVAEAGEKVSLSTSQPGYSLQMHPRDKESGLCTRVLTADDTKLDLFDHGCTWKEA